MAAGGGHKGIGNGNRGRPYGMMLVLAFGAALLGVMVLHKFREKRIFNLLTKEKDRELMSLHLILQISKQYHRYIQLKVLYKGLKNSPLENDFLPLQLAGCKLHAQD
ncbi:hypothetical protein OIU85_003060 [Salix viminalis]|uniref:Uncharacterized protein n=1 Tax=Salix viminalis TaxID=40686 RepID=A0A9Q0PYX9_SALVM|nr:hypothetical protein OIU85_003060 [Salix viminalis]